MLVSADMAELVRVLRAGGVVACPTETFVGLLADARNPQAVERVRALKGRADDNPIGVLVPDLSTLDQLVSDLPAPARALAARHWPGPLTLLLHVRPGLPAALHKDGKLAARVPGASPALELVRAFGGALTATSANKTGEPAASSSEQVAAIFGSQLDALVPGVSPGGLPSTLLDITRDPFVVLRQGPIVVDVAGAPSP